MFEKAEVKILNVKYPISKVEIAGRMCYKSKSKYDKESADKFCKALADRKHYAMLEHAYFVFKVNVNMYDTLKKSNASKFINMTKVVKGYDCPRCIVSLNLRTILENLDNDIIKIFCAKIKSKYDLFFLPDFIIEEEILDKVDVIETPLLNWELDMEEIDIHSYFTFIISTSRAIANEIVRHRKNCSYAQVSTRYVNYNKRERGVRFILPADYEEMREESKIIYENILEDTEIAYNKLVGSGVSPERARDILPLGVKTELVFTANIEAFKHFLDLRLNNSTGKAHPDINFIAKKMNDLLDNHFWLEESKSKELEKNIIDESYFRNQE